MIISTEGPCGAFVGFDVDDDLAADGAEGHGRVIEGELAGASAEV